MTKIIDNRFSLLPFRISDLQISFSKLQLSTIRITQTGHLPQRVLQRKDARFDSWSMAYIVKGRGFYQVDNLPMEVIEAGTIFFVWPGSSFTYGPDTKGDWEEFHIRFEGDRVKEWLENGFVFKQAKRVGIYESWVQMIERIFRLIESAHAHNADRAALLLENLLMEIAQSSPDNVDSKPQLVHHIFEGIANAIYEPVDDIGMASRYFTSVSTLRNLIRIQTGFPYNDYCHRLKMSEAKRLLINTDMKAKEVASLLGYTDNFYFSRLFKKYTGMSANDFRTKGI